MDGLNADFKLEEAFRGFFQEMKIILFKKGGEDLEVKTCVIGGKIFYTVTPYCTAELMVSIEGAVDEFYRTGVVADKEGEFLIDFIDIAKLQSLVPPR